MFEIPTFLVGLAALAAIGIVLLARDWREEHGEASWRGASRIARLVAQAPALSATGCGSVSTRMCFIGIDIQIQAMHRLYLYVDQFEMRAVPISQQRRNRALRLGIDGI